MHLEVTLTEEIPVWARSGHLDRLKKVEGQHWGGRGESMLWKV